MKNTKIKSRIFNVSTLKTVGVIIIFVLAIVLLWYGNVTSNQAELAMSAQVYFDGEYRIADGTWQKIEKGKHISATEGDVILRGNFHISAPNGEYVGLYSSDMPPIAFYINHINLTIYEEGIPPFVLDMENSLLGNSACGVDWTAHTFMGESDKPIEILVHNPHRFGNENAIDEMLSNTAFWTGIDFEKGILERGESQRDIGILFIITSLLFLGSALFSTLIHVKNSKLLWMLGVIILFAGTYITYSAESVSIWQESVVSNTTILGCSMMFYMLFLSMAIVYFLNKTKKLGAITVTILGFLNAVLLAAPMLTSVLFYDTWYCWIIAQMIANLVLLVCLVKEFFVSEDKKRWGYIGFIFPLVAFYIDVVMTNLGVWHGGIASVYIFMCFFIVAMVAVLKIIPNSINAIAKAKELETEKIALNSQLAKSRISTMMSQIRPHFIYNTLGSIEQLCSMDPPKAGELVHNFAKYLRGNFGELDNPKPILMSREMEHVQHYVSIEKVRFPDMTFLFEMNTDDFHIPALTIQPIVENAIKHGLMKLPKGGTIRVVSYETDENYCVLIEDDGLGFDTKELLDERKHVGIRNIRGRLSAMVNGKLEIESQIGVGTKVSITIPKEDKK